MGGGQERRNKNLYTLYRWWVNWGKLPFALSTNCRSF